MESVRSTMNVSSPKPWDMKHGVITQYFRFTVDMFIVLDFFKIISLMCVCLEKLLYWLFVYTNVFAVSITFCDESGLAILTTHFSIFRDIHRTVLIIPIWNCKLVAVIYSNVNEIIILSTVIDDWSELGNVFYE